VYFDNDVKVHAPFDANALARRLGEASEELQRPREMPVDRAEPTRTAWPGFARR
jgi:uncharacterized protein YecE (DUF72 family)